MIALAACSSNESSGGGSGGANQNKGGSTSSSGGSTSSSGGSSSASGGTSSSSGGTSSSSGGSTSGGSSSASGGMQGFSCPGTAANCSMISDFPAGTAQVWGGTDFGGGITTFNGVTRDATKTDVIHVTGAGNKYGGFGIWFNSCSDLSQYTGVSFKISGTAGPTSAIDFQAQTNSDYPWAPDAGASKKGACTGSDPDPMKAWNDCNAPGKTGIALTTTPTTVMINWSDITGGKPKAWDSSASPKEIVGIQWQFPAADTEYQVDVTVDDVTFLGGTQKACATGSSSGGAGGAGGGSSSGGGGGASSSGGAGGASSSGGGGGASSSGGAGGASSSGGAGGARGGAGGAAGNAGNAGHN